MLNIAKNLQKLRGIRKMPRKELVSFAVNFFKKNFLFITVFITGASVLIIEVVAIRVLSPYYGNTIFTTSSVITVILAALSIGYYIGGKLADRQPSLDWFFRTIFLSGICLLLLHSVSKGVLIISSLVFSFFTGPLVSSVFLFFFPALLLGTLSPYAIKLQSVYFPEQGVGTVSGKIFFWSTLGSIMGSLLAGFVLIPNFGINQIIIANGVVLFLLGLLPLLALRSNRNSLYQHLLFFIIIFAAVWSVSQLTDKSIIYSEDGIYEKIVIYEGDYENRPARFFQQDRSMSGAMFLDSEDPADLVFGYTKYYSLYKVFTPDIKNVLIIGGGAYSIPKAMLAELPDTTIDVCEIEPSLFDLSKKYFGLVDNYRLHNYVEDGRRFLRYSDKKYDMIFGDAYFSLFSIPAHLTTQEFFELVKEKLNDGGVFIANMIGDLSQGSLSLTMSEIKTFQTVFPNNYFFAVESPEKNDAQNIMFVGYKSDKKIDLNSPIIANNSIPIIRSLKEKAISIDKFDLSPHIVLTDNFAPVEYMTAKVLERRIGN